jgi:hypothetical protein
MVRVAAARCNGTPNAMRFLEKLFQRVLVARSSGNYGQITAPVRWWRRRPAGYYPEPAAARTSIW